MIQKLLPAHRIVEIPGVQRIDRDAESVFHTVQIHSAHVKGFVADDLRRRETADLVHQFPAVRELGHKIIPGGDIRYGNAVAVRDINDAHDIIVPGLIKRLGVQIRPRRHDPHDLALHDPFGCLRVFHLLTDGHLIAFGHQTVQISFHSVIRDAAHGRPLFLSAVFSGKGDLQFPGRRQRVVEEHLIKITQPVKKDAVLVLGLGLHILFHHWC